MGLIKKLYEQDQENKILRLKVDFGYNYLELRPVGLTDTEEHYLGPKNERIIWNNIYHIWLAEL